MYEIARVRSRITLQEGWICTNLFRNDSERLEMNRIWKILITGMVDLREALRRSQDAVRRGTRSQDAVRRGKTR